MKQYQVKITRAALADMEQIYPYVAQRLPERCPLVDCEPERSQGLRHLLVDRYSVFYLVGEDAVSVARILYSSSDLTHRLRSMK